MKSNGHYVDLPPEGWTFVGDHTIVVPKMLVKGLLPYRGIAFIGGQSGAGKTFIAGHLSTSLSSATPFFGRIVKERVGVAIIAAEGTEQTGNRLTAAAQAQGLDIRDLPIAWRGGAPLKSADDVAVIGTQLEELGTHIQQQYDVRLGVAILDTVAATFDMEDEDSNSEVAKAIRKMRDLGDKFKGLVIPIHHYGKSAATGLRGGSAWRAGADVVLSVIAERNELTGKVRDESWRWRSPETASRVRSHRSISPSPSWARTKTATRSGPSSSRRPTGRARWPPRPD
jgi:RecA-family ATPase